MSRAIILKFPHTHADATLHPSDAPYELAKIGMTEAEAQTLVDMGRAEWVRPSKPNKPKSAAEVATVEPTESTENHHAQI
ncbi:hypothetical protein [Methylomagnum sp.]